MSIFDKLAVLEAYEEALVQDREMTIICWINGKIQGWKHYPSMLKFPML